MKILIVDDCQEDQLIFKKLINKIFNEVEIHDVKSGEEALKLIKNGMYFDCILLDYYLIDMDGIEFLKGLGQFLDSRILPATIALTGQRDQVIASEFIKVGARDYLCKSRVDFSSLEQAINNAIKNYLLDVKLADQQKEAHSFSYTVAHDLEAPLRRIMLYCDLLQKKIDNPNPKVKNFIKTIYEDSKYAIDFVNDILNYSKIGRKNITCKPIDLNEVLQRVERNLDVIITNCRGDIVYKNLPVIQGDKTSLIQLFQNLISNSLKFHRDKNFPPKVTISAEKYQNDHWRILINDNGIGIPENEREAIFKPFKRLHPSEDFNGIGIGLATCRKIVSQHSGKIWIDSREGQGTTFNIALPSSLKSSNKFEIQ